VHSGTDRLPYDSPDERYNELYRNGRKVDFDGCIDGVCASRLLRDVNARILEDGFDPHELFPDEVIDFMIDLYDGSINYVDDQLAELFELLRELGIYDSTVIIVTSDHGEEFLDHGFFLHRQGVYDEVARVPLIIRYPGAEFGGTRFGGMVSTVDLMPTILDYLGLPPPSETNGSSVLPQLGGAPKVRDDAVIASALRTERWKVVVGRDEVFDLEADPMEQINVADLHPDRKRALESAWRRQVADLRDMHRRLAEIDVAASPDTADLTAEEREALEALGYVQ
jgi:arylsulfatase A-like enzyme